MATVLYLVLDRETGEVSFASAGHPPPLVLAPDGPHFLEGGRSVPIGAVDPARVPRGQRRAAARRLAAALHRRPGRAPRRAARASASTRWPRRPVRPGASSRRSATRVLAGVLGEREPGDDVALLAVRPRPVAAERSASRCPPSRSRCRACAAGWRASCTRRAPRRGDLRDHAHGLRGGRQRDRARLRARRRHLRGRGEPRRRRARGDGARPRHWRERRGAHRGRGLNIIEGLMDEVEVSTRAGRHGGDDAEAAGRRTGGVSTLAEIAVERHGGTVVARLSGEVDMTNAARVREQLLDAVPERRAGAGGRPGRLPLPRLGGDRGGLRPLAAARAPPPGAAAGGAAELAAAARARAHRRGSVAPVHESLESALAQ